MCTEEITHGLRNHRLGLFISARLLLAAGYVQGRYVIQIMKSKIIFFAIIVTSIYFIGCDTFYYIPLSDNSDTLSVNFNCGKLKMSLLVWQGHTFSFNQTYDVSDTVKLFSDSLYIEYKNNVYHCSHYVDKCDSSLSFIGFKNVRNSFEIDDKVNKGDTIKVFTKGYIHCESKSVYIKPMILIIKKDIRGPMGS